MSTEDKKDNKMEWYPWVDLNVKAPEATNNNLPILEPPCKHCEHFKPQIVFANTEKGMVAHGVQICHANEMHQDFSCLDLRSL